VLPTTINFVPSSFDVATGDPRLGGAIVEVDAATGKATAIRRVMLDEKELATLPSLAALPDEAVTLLVHRDACSCAVPARTTTGLSTSHRFCEATAGRFTA